LAKADETVFLWLNGLVGELPFFDRIVELVVSDYLVPVSLALALVGMWFAGGDKLTRQKHQIGVFVALSAMAISSLAVFTINAAYFRPRPFVDHEVTRLFYAPTDSSFPSNPAAAAFAIAVAVWAVNRRLGSLLLTAAALYGFARVYAGVHYPLDIVSGALIAIVVTFLTFKIRDLLGPILTWVIKVGRIFCLA
jgi:undecaprenyl-diphosphatase